MISEESRVEPEDDGGEHHHRPIVECAFLVARRQPTPLFEPVDTALHDVAPRIDRPVEDQRATRPSGAARLLIAPLWDGVGDVALARLHFYASWRRS
jgi:hypothetical protein